MAELSMPFDSNPVDGKEDRVYTARDFGAYFKQFVGNGVYPNPSNGLRVDASGTSLVVTINEGAAFLNGHTYELSDEKLQMAIPSGHMSYNRKDAVVVQLNHTQRAIGVKYKEGVPTSNPIVSALIRNDDIYEIRLAEILVRSGAKQLTQADVTDTRLNGTLCGMVSNVVKSVDTTALFNQYQTYLNQQITAWNATKSQQGRDWQNQMTTQQTTFQRKQSEIEGWYDGLQADISKLQTFDFDNMTGFSGCQVDTVQTSSGYLETILVSATMVKVAERATARATEGFVENIKVYERDGIALMKQFTVTTQPRQGGGFIVKISGEYQPPEPASPNNNPIKAGPNMGLKIID